MGKFASCFCLSLVRDMSADTQWVLDKVYSCLLQILYTLVGSFAHHNQPLGSVLIKQISERSLVEQPSSGAQMEVQIMRLLYTQLRTQPFN